MGRAKTTVEPPPPLMCLVERIEHEDAKILSGATHQSNKDLARRARRRRRRRKFCTVLIVFVVFYLDVGRLFALDNQTGGISNSSKRQDYLAVGELSPERADNLNRDIIQADSLKVQNQSDPSRGGPPPPVVWDQQGKSGKEITTADQAVDTSSSPDGVSGGGGGQDSDSVISSSEIATNPLSAGGGGGEEVAHQNTPATASASITAEEANAVESPRNDHDDVPTSNKPDAPEAALKLFPDINTTQPAVATTNTTTAGELLVQGLEREQQRQQRQRAWLEDKIPFTDAAAAGDGGSDQDNHGHNSGGGGELESVSQRASRLLLQLLVLGFFILLSSSLIVVYSIKFCVCQRRKERRLLRRALIGDISSSRCSQQHLQPAMGAAADPHHYHFSQAQLLALRNSSQPIHTISAAASAATNHHNHHLVPSTLSASSSPLSATIDDQHTIECACPQWRRLPAALANSQQDDYHHHHSHHHQLEFGGTRQQNARFFDNSSAVLQTEPIISTGQPQLVLALLNRLQQLLAGETLAPARATPLSASSSQLLSHQQMVAHLQSQLSQPSCGCQHLDPQHLMLASLSARPPAYSELFLIGSTGNVCAEPATTVAAAGEAAPETATTIERQSEAEMRQQQSQQRQLDQARGSLDNVGTPG